MSEYREKRIVVEEVPVGSRPVVETRYDSVVSERQGMSGGTVGALVVAAITAAIVITMMILNSQQRNTDEQLAQERANNALAQTPGQPAQQQPIIVNLPASQPATAIPYPVPAPSQAAPIAPSSASVEADVTSLLKNDEALASQIIDVRVSNGIATLSGDVPAENLKRRAEQIARTVSGVQSVMNDIAVRP